MAGGSTFSGHGLTSTGALLILPTGLLDRLAIDGLNGGERCAYGMSPLVVAALLHAGCTVDTDSVASWPDLSTYAREAACGGTARRQSQSSTAGLTSPTRRRVGASPRSGGFHRWPRRTVRFGRLKVIPLAPRFPGAMAKAVHLEYVRVISNE